MSKKIMVSDIFSGLGVPKETYVAQEEGRFERLLRQGIREKGTLCLLTGSSKTGKTTLYNKVLSDLGLEPLIIRCSETLGVEEFWTCPLEAVDFRRLVSSHKKEVSEVAAGGKVGGNIGWGWLAGLIGEVSLGVRQTSSEEEVREAILSKPSSFHLIPLLTNSNATLVVEDFHYLTEENQRFIFQQWKSFIDAGVSVIVVGTTHHGVDLAYANPDLVGRIQQIDLNRWSDKDLKQIAVKGFEKLEIDNPVKAIETIAKESVGLPIITQQACAQLFFDKGFEMVEKGDAFGFSNKCAFSALHGVAIGRYRQFESWYERLVTGPRKRSRKYNTYELILSAFSMDPPRFVLKRHEIDERFSSMPIGDSERPPAPSINSTLSALEKFQKKNGFELLEWSRRDQAIYVLEPAFLFYLRWRIERTKLPSAFEMLKTLLKTLNVADITEKSLEIKTFK